MSSLVGWWVGLLIYRTKRPVSRLVTSSVKSGLVKNMKLVQKHELKYISLENLCKRVTLVRNENHWVKSFIAYFV